jgi:tetratricopeptide (TPR) repeat protein
LTWAVFLPTLRCDFVCYDDPEYVTANPYVLQGLNATDARWAFSTFHLSNWNPLTWLSLQIDATLWRTPRGQPEPAGFHLTNTLLHGANAALLYLALRAFSGAPGRSAATALLFAVHPLRAESVAWVSERKDVLCVFFGMLALWAYAAYTKAPSVGRYLAVTAAFALSLGAKPALVALPFLFLVLDWWPCGRVSARGDWQRRAVEKTPLLALTAASCAVTYVASAAGGATRSFASFPIEVRAANAIVAYAAYLAKTVWPFDLAVFYRHSGGLPPAGQLGASVLLLGTVTVAALATRRRAPYFLAGWLWFAGMLVPNSGLIQIGNHAYADRYSYFPQIGLLIAFCWAAPAVFAGRPAVAWMAVGVVAVALVARTEDQLRSWRDSATLWQHDLAVTGENSTALASLGALASSDGQPRLAEAYFRRALDLDDALPIAHLNLGTMLAGQKRLDEAGRHLERACELEPNSASAHLHFGHVLFDLGQFDRAARELARAADLAPETAEAYWHLARLSVTTGRLERAVEYYRETLRRQPDFPQANYWLGRALLRSGRAGACVDPLREEVRRNPGFVDAHLLLAQVLEETGDWAGAARHYETVTRLNPKRAEAWYGLGATLARRGAAAEVERHLTQAVQREPGSAAYRVALAGALRVVAAGQAADGRYSAAAATERRARDLVAAAGSPELVGGIEERMHGYERSETVRPPGGDGRIKEQ